MIGDHVIWEEGMGVYVWKLGADKLVADQSPTMVA